MERTELDDLKAYHEKELNGCKRSFEAGNIGALLSAIHYCRSDNLTAPQWLLDASYDLLVEAIRHVKFGKPGRARSPFARFRQDMIHFARSDTVQEVREKQKEIREEVIELRKRKNVPPSLLKEREKMLRWAGRDWGMAYRCASVLLRGTDSFAGPDAMKASYLKVRRLAKDPKQTMRFRLIDNYTMQRLKLLKVFEPPQDRKPRVLFDPDR